MVAEKRSVRPSVRCVSFLLPIPPKELKPNGSRGITRGARAHVARVKGAYQADVCTAIRCALGPELPHLIAADMDLDWRYAVRRRRDDDNLIASFKAARDVFAQIGLVDDDSTAYLRMMSCRVSIVPKAEIGVYVTLTKREVLP